MALDPGAEEVPGAQPLHDPADALEYCPARQEEQNPEPAAAKVPAAHAPVTAVVEHADPVGQITHAVVPVV